MIYYLSEFVLELKSDWFKFIDNFRNLKITNNYTSSPCWTLTRTLDTFARSRNCLH